MSGSRQCVVMAVLLALSAGCTRWQQRPLTVPPQLLRPASASPESVTLEIFFARAPWADSQVNGQLWQQIDEQQLPAELRRQLANNGFRAGLTGGQVPSELAELMKLTDVPETEAEMQQVESLESEPAVRRRVMQLRSGRRGELIASGIYPSLPLLIREEGQLRGKTYEKAQGLFGVQVAPQPDGRVQLTLAPELHHGEARQQWSGQDGIFQMEMSRPKEVFPELELVTLLSPGQMLVVSCLPDRSGSLGAHFFRDDSARGQEQKVLIIRLVQTPQAELYQDEAAPAEE